MKKNVAIITGIVVVVAIAGGVALFHKSNTSNTTNTSSTRTATDTSNGILVTKSSSSLGQYFTEPNGQPLYTYNLDTAGVSKCSGSCLAAWPAYEDKGATTNLPSGVSTIKRTDNGATQFTYNGMPLYTFVGDSNGQVTGNGVQDFTVAKPAGATNTSSGSNASSSSW